MIMSGMSQTTLKTRRFGFLGAGNMNQAILRGLLESKTLIPSQVAVTNRSAGKLQKVHDTLGVQIFKTNEELIEKSDVIILGVKPQDLILALEPIASTFHSGHTVMSLAAGIPLRELRRVLPEAGSLVRIMPNSPIHIMKAVVGYCADHKKSEAAHLVEEMFAALGVVVPVEEGEAFEALTVACSSGVGFIFELMEYWQEWLEEHDFDPELARKMTVRTFLGAAQLADLDPTIPVEELRNKVVSKKGVTAAGLDSMRELEIERALRYSFEKAVLRDRELGRVQIDFAKKSQIP